MSKVTRGKHIIKSYLAGIIDGEGSIFITKINNKRSGNVWYRLSLTCSMTEKEAVDLLIETFTPHLKAYIYIGGRKKGHKPVYQWLVTGGTAVKIAKELLPYIRIKKDQLELGIEFQEWREKLGQGKKRTEEEISKCDDYYLRMKKLK